MPSLPPCQPDPLATLSESLRALAQRGEIRHYRKHTLLIEEGDRGDTLYLILAGRLRSYASGDKGREITYGIYGPGEYLGEMSLDGGPRSANVVTLDDCSCVVITRTTLRQHIAEHPEFAFELIAKLIRRARAATTKSDNASCASSTVSPCRSSSARRPTVARRSPRSRTPVATRARTAPRSADRGWPRILRRAAAEHRRVRAAAPPAAAAPPVRSPGRHRWHPRRCRPSADAGRSP